VIVGPAIVLVLFDASVRLTLKFRALYTWDCCMLGRVTADQLEADKVNTGISNLKSQTGISLAFYYHINDYLVLGVDYFRFQSDWWGAPNARFTDDTGSTTELLPGYLAGEKQVLNFINAGATFHW